MAVTFIPSASRLQLKIDAGVNAQGKPVTKIRNFANVKPSATEQDVYDVAQALAGLQQHAVISVLRKDDGELRNV